MSAVRIGAATLIEADRLQLLGHWAYHYSLWCAHQDMIVMILSHGQSPGSTLDMIETCEAAGIHWEVDPMPFHTLETHARCKAMTKKFFSWEGWHFNVDSDEFFDIWADVQRLIGECESSGKKFVRSRMIDMVGPGGTLPEMTCENPHFTFPIETRITRRIVGGYDIKDCLLINPLYGNHNAHDVDLRARHPEIQKLRHFKWDATVLDRMRHRLENRDRFPYWSAFKKFLDYYDRHGRIDLKTYELDTGRPEN